MTPYGTFPATTNNRELRQQIIRSGLLESRRPWKQMAISFSIPQTFSDTLTRLNSNISYFFTNYIIFIFFLLFLCLLFRPDVPLAVFISIVAAWLFFYFLRDDPVVVFGNMVDERVVLALLMVFTVALLFLTVTVKVVAALAVGVLAVVVHGVFRKTDDMVLMVRDHEEGVAGSGCSWPVSNDYLKGTKL